jgi:hypothetical protein
VSVPFQRVLMQKEPNTEGWVSEIQRVPLQGGHKWYSGVYSPQDEFESEICWEFWLVDWEDDMGCNG